MSISCFGHCTTLPDKLHFFVCSTDCSRVTSGTHQWCEVILIHMRAHMGRKRTPASPCFSFPPQTHLQSGYNKHGTHIRKHTGERSSDRPVFGSDGQIARVAERSALCHDYKHRAANELWFACKPPHCMLNARLHFPSRHEAKKEKGGREKMKSFCFGFSVWVEKENEPQRIWRIKTKLRQNQQQKY